MYYVVVYRRNGHGKVYKYRTISGARAAYDYYMGDDVELYYKPSDSNELQLLF